MKQKALADVFLKLVRRHCKGAPDNIGELLVEAMQKHRKPPDWQPLSVSVGLSKKEAATFLREVRIVEANKFLRELGEPEGKTLYVLLSERNNIATHSKVMADLYYDSGKYVMVEVLLID